MSLELQALTTQDILSFKKREIYCELESHAIKK